MCDMYARTAREMKESLSGKHRIIMNIHCVKCKHCEMDDAKEHTHTLNRWTMKGIM